MQTFAAYIRERAHDEKVGLWFEGKSWTWREIVHEAAARASHLRTISPRDGKTQRHVGMLMQNVPDFVFWLLATTLTGDVVIGINPTRRGAELAHDIRHVDCDLLVTEAYYDDLLEGVDLGLGEGRVLDIGSDDYAKMLDAHRGAPVPGEAIDPHSINLLLFSSGSTGAPKAVICSHGRLGALTTAMVDRVSLHRESVNYLCLPLFHGHAIMMNLATAVAVGAKIVMVRKFSATRFASDVREHGITYFNYVGRVMHYVLAQPENPDDLDNALEVAFGSEAPHREAMEFTRRFGCEVREGYGASEGMLRIVPVPERPNALGLPAPGMIAEVRDPETNAECPRALFDDDGKLLNAEAATGEIVAVGRGSGFEGYYNNERAMAERLRFGGEDFWTGDLGYRDSKGYFYFAGRSNDWLRVDGENFGVSPVEQILTRFPAFAGVHCFGVADPVTGDRLMCAFTLVQGQAFEPLAFEHFLDSQRDLGTKWRPTYLRQIDEVPLTASGKINKAPLRATGWEADRVWYREAPATSYRELAEPARERLRAEFARNGRTNLLPHQGELS